jgi:hypothetical protein
MRVKQGRHRRSTHRRKRPAPRGQRHLSWFLGVAVFLVVLGWVLVDAVDRHPFFRVQSIHIQSGKHVDEGTIAGLLGIEVGTSFFRVDPEQSEELVASHPWVKSAVVRRTWKRSVEVEVEEEVAVVAVAMGPLFLSNREGVLFKRVSVGEEISCPVVTGLGQNTEAGSALSPEEHQALLDVIAFLTPANSEALGGHGIAEAHIGRGGRLTLALRGVDLRVHLGAPPWQDRLGSVRTAIAALRDKDLQATTLWLGGPRRPPQVTARLSARSEVLERGRTLGDR